MPSNRKRTAAGITLIELLIAMFLAMVATLAITHVVFDAEAEKRATTTGSDAQANGASALAQLRRALLSAGYGYTQAPGAIGCTIEAVHNGAPVPGFPAVLAPVRIVDGGGEGPIVGGAAGPPDAIRVLASAKTSYSVPMRLVLPYAATQTKFEVAATLGVQPKSATAPGDLLLVGSSASTTCEVIEASGVPAGRTIERTDDPSGWNQPGHPSGSYTDGDFLVNLGSFMDRTFSVDQGALVVKQLRLGATGEPNYDPTPTELQSNIVNLQALYGKDADGDGAIEVWNNVTPTSQDEWLAVAAIRVAVVARSTHYEKDAVTTDVLWDVGAAVPVSGTLLDCGGSKCLSLAVKGDPDWDHYRYKVFESVVPLRNVVWGAS